MQPRRQTQSGPDGQAECQPRRRSHTKRLGRTREVQQNVSVSGLLFWNQKRHVPKVSCSMLLGATSNVGAAESCPPSAMSHRS